MKKILSFLVLSLFLANSAHAQDIGTMFANFTASSEAIIKLVQAVSIIIGVYLVIGSIFKFVQLDRGQIGLKTPLIMFLSGIGIFALSGSIAVVTQTMAMGNGPGNILLPNSSKMSAQTSAALLGVLTFIRMVGYIAFVRGWLLINQHAQGKEGTLGRGLTHIFGGVAAINVVVTAKILANTFAPGLPLPI